MLQHLDVGCPALELGQRWVRHRFPVPHEPRPEAALTGR